MRTGGTGSTRGALLASDARREELRALAGRWPCVTVSGPALANLDALLAGFLAPLRGYGIASDAGGTGAGLEGGTGPPSAAFGLDVPPDVAEQAPPSAHIALRDPEGVLLAVLHVEERAQFGGAWQLGGAVEGLELPRHDDFTDRRFSPGEIRSRLRALGRERTLAFWPGPVLHAGIRAAIVAAAERLDASLLVLISSAPTEHDELGNFARVRALEISARRLPPNRVVTAVVPLATRRDDRGVQARHVLVARNCGADDLAWDTGDADTSTQCALEAAAGMLGVRLVEVRSWMFDAAAGALVEPDEGTAECAVAPANQALLSWEADPQAWLLDREELAALRHAYVPREARGFTVFFTGLSGSGKSTIARALRLRLMERTGRPVTLLDGDRVRRHLSAELGFSREHRDLNIMRIGWVAAEITRHGGIAICSPIAPYDRIRRRVRQMVQATGGFVLVHVATPLETCEARDRKGLYARARAGLLTQFTGISDPYEPPADADLAIDTRHTAVSAACDIVIQYLEQRGYVGHQVT